MTPGVGNRPGRSVRLGVWIVYWVVLFVVNHRPLPGSIGLPGVWADKAVHFGLYLVLTLLAGWYLSSAGRRPSVRSLLMWAAVFLVYAGFDEWLQQYVGRTMSLADFIADAAGIAAGTLVVANRRRKPQPAMPAAGSP